MHVLAENLHPSNATQIGQQAEPALENATAKRALSQLPVNVFRVTSSRLNRLLVIMHVRRFLRAQQQKQPIVIFGSVIAISLSTQ
jgi:hypothetical protein